MCISKLTWFTFYPAPASQNELSIQPNDINVPDLTNQTKGTMCHFLGQFLISQNRIRKQTRKGVNQGKFRIDWQRINSIITLKVSNTHHNIVQNRIVLVYKVEHKPCRHQNVIHAIILTRCIRNRKFQYTAPKPLLILKF